MGYNSDLQEDKESFLAISSRSSEPCTCSCAGWPD
jgi:hypothetical protein